MIGIKVGTGCGKNHIAADQESQGQFWKGVLVRNRVQGRQGHHSPATGGIEGDPVVLLQLRRVSPTQNGPRQVDCRRGPDLRDSRCLMGSNSDTLEEEEGARNGREEAMNVQEIHISDGLLLNSLPASPAATPIHRWQRATSSSILLPRRPSATRASLSGPCCAQTTCHREQAYSNVADSPWRRAAGRGPPWLFMGSARRGGYEGCPEQRVEPGHCTDEDQGQSEPTQDSRKR
mmetsp:Transcript_1196/g.2925  ORF Transcript_1196/g.2925 Transcript_1196/m.2925 type:complete len:233 (+) Transcript_1196:715-1413(+)